MQRGGENTSVIQPSSNNLPMALATNSGWLRADLLLLEKQEGKISGHRQFVSVLHQIQGKVFVL